MSTLTDYRRWHHLQVETGDIDPVYPVLRLLADRWKLDPDQRAWLATCHVVYYHLGAGLTLFERCPSPLELPSSAEALDELGLLTLPTATERRAHRDVRQLAKHLLGLRELGGMSYDWYGGDGWAWPELNRRIMTLHGNGRWAAYKLAEMLQKVASAPTQATDAGHRHSSGPRKGLADLYDELPEGSGPEAVRELDELTAGLQAWVGEADVAHIETSLCDFHSLVKGAYYLGHDIDGMADQLRSPRVPSSELILDVWEARSDVFDHALLGEHHGWTGVRRDLKRAYRDHGVLDIRELGA